MSETRAHRAYGAGRLASPDISDTGWGSAITASELRSIAQQAIDPSLLFTKHPNNLVVGTGAAENDEQWQRSVRPINFVADPEHAERLSFIAAWPGLYVCKESKVNPIAFRFFLAPFKPLSQSNTINST